MSISNAPSIAIVGGGLAGLVCARVLNMHGIPVVVFEAEAAFDDRPQGGRLDMHADSGQVAIKAAGLFDVFQQVSHQEGTKTKVFAAETGDVLYHGIPGGVGWNPEMDRGELRKMFLDVLPPEIVSWGSKVSRVEKLPDGRARVVLANGERHDFDQVIGADGTWSKVRPVLTKIKPRYNGVSLLESRIENWAQTEPVSHGLVSPGSMFAVGDRQVMMVHSGEDAWWSAGFYAPRKWWRNVDWSDTAGAKAAVLAQTSTWHPTLRGMIQASTKPLTPRPMFTLPVGMRWRHVPGITLVGDAAHVMSIFAGRGANLALLDGAALANAIVESGENWRDGVRQAEREMFRRTVKASLLSVLALNQYFGPNAPKKIAYTFSTAQAGPVARFRRLLNMGTSTLHILGDKLLRPADLRYDTFKVPVKVDQIS